MRRYILMLMMATAIATTGCKKDTDDTDNQPSTPARKELISNVWKPNEVYFDGTKVEQTGFEQLRLTMKASDSSYIYYVNRTDNHSGKWVFNVDETRILFDKGTTKQNTWEITYLDATNLKVRYIEDHAVYEFYMIPDK